jgi:hypothetical protein
MACYPWWWCFSRSVEIENQFTITRGPRRLLVLPVPRQGWQGRLGSLTSDPRPATPGPRTPRPRAIRASPGSRYPGTPWPGRGPGPAGRAWQPLRSPLRLKCLRKQRLLREPGPPPRARGAAGTTLRRSAEASALNVQHHSLSHVYTSARRNEPLLPLPSDWNKSTPATRRRGASPSAACGLGQTSSFHRTR